MPRLQQHGSFQMRTVLSVASLGTRIRGSHRANIVLVRDTQCPDDGGEAWPSARGRSQPVHRQLRSLPIEDLGSGSDDQILELARRHGLSAYDASYLALALDQNLPLGTSDRQLAAAALRESVEIIDS
jgi:hypothetical protein